MQKFKSYQGTWHIYEMKMWDEDYFNMAVQAYLKMGASGGGDFQWGLVCGQIDGEIDTWETKSASSLPGTVTTNVTTLHAAVG